MWNRESPGKDKDFGVMGPVFRRGRYSGDSCDGRVGRENREKEVSHLGGGGRDRTAE